MIYRLVKKFDDEDIPIILSVYKQPLVSQFISIDEDNYWRYITTTDHIAARYSLLKTPAPIGAGVLHSIKLPVAPFPQAWQDPLHRIPAGRRRSPVPSSAYPSAYRGRGTHRHGCPSPLPA